MSEARIKVAPELVAYTDEEHRKLTIEIAIPGVPAENIDLKLHEDSIYLSAALKDTEFVTALAFCCPVNKDKAEAAYENGLLKVEVPFKDPMEDAVKVPIKSK